MSDTHESVKPRHKHRWGFGKGMVEALGFNRLSEQMATSHESASPADSGNVTDEYRAPENIEHVPASQPVGQSLEPTGGTTDGGMSYIEAIQAAKSGWHVYRVSWSEGIYVFVEDGERIMKCTEGDHLPNQMVVDKFTPLVDDVLSNDWEMLPMPSKTFLEALTAMISGQFARRPDWQYLLQIQGGRFCSPNNPQQEHALRYEDVAASDWEIHVN